MKKKCALVFGATVFAVAGNLRAETPLEAALLNALRDAHFERMIDFGAGNDNHPVNGRGWKTDRVTMTAWDTARLFWIFDGGPGEMRRDADRQPVTAKLLSDSSRAFLKKLLSEQGFIDALTRANFPGAKNVRPGIPSRVAERSVNPRPCGDPVFRCSEMIS